MPKNYSRTAPPLNPSSSIEVILKIDHLDILEIDDINFTIKLQMYLGALWKEPRILKNSTITEDEEGGTNLDLKYLDMLWVPDLDIYNLSKIENFIVVRNLAGKE